MTFLPVGSLALRVNMFSALCGALTISLLFSLLYALLPDVTAVGAPMRCLEWSALVIGIRVILAFLRSR